MIGARVLSRAASSPLARPARALVERLVPAGTRPVTIRGGLARGVRAELDLRTEKAFWLGHYEPPVQDFLAAHVRPGDVVYDVGAYVGFFALCAAALGARVFAFEPDPGNAERLRRNAAASGLPIEAVEAAVWEDEQGASLVPGDSGLEGRVVPGGSVATVTLDAFAARHVAPAVLKIDVEGAEASVLRGAAGVLAATVRALTCEVHEGVDADELRSLLQGFDVTLRGSTRLEAVRPYHVAS